jgi:catechol 2,3-dioxygenase-like lactoylglutathione lyase family enzyme
MGIEKLDHYSVRTADLERAIRFYEEALGFHSGPRPPFRFSGAWMYTPAQPGQAEGRPVVHLIGVDHKDAGALSEYLGGKLAAAKPDTGALDHIAFAATGISELHARLKLHGIAYRERKVPNMELHQVFIEDPEGLTIELNYSQPADIAAGSSSLTARAT